jgi:hypothetical protein
MKPIALILCLGLAACATDAVRPTASATMRITQSFKTEMASFADRQNAEIDARHRAIAVLQQNTRLSSFRGAKQRMDWRAMKDEAAIRIFEEATSPENAPSLSRVLLQDPASAFPASTVSVDRKQYDALMKALEPLASKSSPKRDLIFLIGVGQTVAGMNKDIEKASKTDSEAGSLAPPTVASD